MYAVDELDLSNNLDQLIGAANEWADDQTNFSAADDLLLQRYVDSVVDAIAEQMMRRLLADDEGEANKPPEQPTHKPTSAGDVRKSRRKSVGPSTPRENRASRLRRMSAHSRDSTVNAVRPVGTPSTSRLSMGASSNGRRSLSTTPVRPRRVFSD